jgi:cell wall assembly regulator SMI1
MDVQGSWAHVVSWCQDHAPETAAAIRPPADAALLRQAEQATSGSWPEDLRTWYTLADGTQRTPAGYVLPFYCPLPLQAVMSHWSMWQEIWADIIASSRNEEAEDHYDLARLEAQPAGTAAWMFLPSFVPIAEDQAGSDMFVDTRSGRLRGCVTEFVKGDADPWGPKWPSVTAMLADLAEGLQAGRPVGRWLPVVLHGRLDWEVAARA